VVPIADTQQRSYTGTAVLKLTSGSTGAPKATLTSESQLIADGGQIIAAMDIRPSDVQIAAVPVSHSYGLGNLMLPLLLQGTAFVLRETFVPQTLPADARRYSARVFPGVPFMFEYFLANPPANGWPPSLGRLISAGAPLAATTIRAFHTRYQVKIHSFYGASETGGIAYDADDDVDDTATVGRPLPGVTVTLRHDHSGGERVHVTSAAIANGYSDDGGDAFVDGGFLTGDYGSWDAWGRLILVGRASAFVNVAGRKVQPDEVELVLRAMPGIADSRVIAADDERRGQQIVACVVVERGSDVSARAVRRFCAARLAPHKIPRAIIFVDEIPLTARGKTDRAALDGLVRARLHA
jgi:acyl-CoA synthetase (AMP-forming)/AMP-acid ligase II